MWCLTSIIFIPWEGSFSFYSFKEWNKFILIHDVNHGHTHEPTYDLTHALDHDPNHELTHALIVNRPMTRTMASQWKNVMMFFLIHDQTHNPTHDQPHVRTYACTMNPKWTMIESLTHDSTYAYALDPTHDTTHTLGR